MPFLQNPLGLLGLLALPAILALHLFRRRYRPTPISALFLWETLPPSTVAGRRRETLQRSPSLWLELAAALFLALALAGPRACSGRAEHFVAVVDGSVSMGARGFLERARAELVARLDRLPSPTYS